MKQTFTTIILALTLIACIQNKKPIEIENGDLLFVQVSESYQLSSAINRVTQSEETKNYSHMGIAKLDQNSMWILHSSTSNGTEKISLTKFIEQESPTNSIHIYRLKSEYKAYITDALHKAESYLGLPYNFSYVLNDSSLYCSDYIHRIFANHDIFELNPMTFVNPATLQTDSAWIKFYRKLELSVPEGLLGCNPNGLASSPKIEFIGTYQ